MASMNGSRIRRMLRFRRCARSRANLLIVIPKNIILMFFQCVYMTKEEREEKQQ